MSSTLVLLCEVPGTWATDSPHPAEPRSVATIIISKMATVMATLQAADVGRDKDKRNKSTSLPFKNISRSSHTTLSSNVIGQIQVSLGIVVFPTAAMTPSNNCKSGKMGIRHHGHRLSQVTAGDSNQFSYAT